MLRAHHRRKNITRRGAETRARARVRSGQTCSAIRTNADQQPQREQRAQTGSHLLAVRVLLCQQQTRRRRQRRDEMSGEKRPTLAERMKRFRYIAPLPNNKPSAAMVGRAALVRALLLLLAGAALCVSAGECGAARARVGVGAEVWGALVPSRGVHMCCGVCVVAAVSLRRSAHEGAAAAAPGGQPLQPSVITTTTSEKDHATRLITPAGATLKSSSTTGATVRERACVRARTPLAGFACGLVVRVAIGHRGEGAVVLQRPAVCSAGTGCGRQDDPHG